jgi:replication factor C subunit 3/5
MALFADKYQPTSLANLDYGSRIGRVLSSLAKSDQMPHIIIEGARGAGKKTRVNLFLKEKYGSFNTSRVTVNIDIPGKTSEEVKTLASRYHFQFNPHIHHIYDRTLMQSFISSVVQYEIISGVPYRIIVIEDADLLSLEAQESLRKTLETYIQTCRFIFLSNLEGHIIDPIYSRCVKIDVNSPTDQEILAILTNICKTENVSIKPDAMKQIVQGSQRDLSKALRYLEKFSLRVKYANDVPFILKEYDSVYSYCCKIIETLIGGTDIVGTMDAVRSYLYELVNYCTDNKELIAILLNITLTKLPKTCHEERFRLCNMASVREESIRQSSKSVYHVEGFCLFIFGIVKARMEQNAAAAAKKHKLSTGTARI